MILNTAEKFLLINKHPAKRRFLISDIALNHGIIGAVLLDMSLRNYINIENDLLIAKNNADSGDQIFDEILTIIAKSKKRRSIKYWMRTLTMKSQKTKWLILSELSNKKLIRIQKDKFLGIIPYRSSYLIDSKYRNDLIVSLRDKILRHKKLKNEDFGLLGLIDACKMQKIISSNRDEQKTIKTELKNLLKESPISEAVQKTIQELQLAIIAAIVSTTVAASMARR